MHIENHKLGIIINPVAGRNKGQQVWHGVRNELVQRNIQFKEKISTYPGETEKIAAQLEKEGCRKIAVVGGDGSINEVINNINLNRTKIGLIPAGTGNDFCRTVHLPVNPLEALNIVLQGYTQQIDLGQITSLHTSRLFYNIAGIGFDAEIAREVNNRLKWIGGAPAYILAVLKLLITFRNFPIAVNFDKGGPVKINCFLLAVGNAKYIGGGMKLIPSAEPDDGLFHILVVKDIGKATVIAKIHKLFSGTHLSHPNILEKAAKEIEILPLEPVNNASNLPTIHCDGEIIGTLPVKVKLLPKKLNFILPKPL